MPLLSVFVWQNRTSSNKNKHMSHHLCIRLYFMYIIYTVTTTTTTSLIDIEQIYFILYMCVDVYLCPWQSACSCWALAIICSQNPKFFSWARSMSWCFNALTAFQWWRGSKKGKLGLYDKQNGVCMRLSDVNNKDERAKNEWMNEWMPMYDERRTFRKHKKIMHSINNFLSACIELFRYRWC